jgi:hypothetical protein
MKDLEDKFLWCKNILDKMQSDLWDRENQNYENEERFKKIVEGALFKMNDPSASFSNGRHDQRFLVILGCPIIFFYKCHHKVYLLHLSN